ncbi:MAG: J domain-containing protein [Chloroflexota bacterium]
MEFRTLTKRIAETLGAEAPEIPEAGPQGTEEAAPEWPPITPDAYTRVSDMATLDTSADEHLRQLQADMQVAQEELRQVEAILGEEQAAVNAFLMHCLLKLGPWVDQIIDLYTEKQRILIRKQMHKQAQALGSAFDEEAWLEENDLNFEDESYLDGLIEESDLPYDITTSDEKMSRRIYRELARKHHPDLAEGALQKSYATSMMAAVNDAYARRDTQALKDLAGELDPKAVDELNKAGKTQSAAARKLQQQLRRCRQRRRKVTLQLKSLRAETTAQLWRKAQTIDNSDGTNWWDEVADSLKGQIRGYQEDIDQLVR